MADNEVSMMMSVYPGAMTGFSTLMAGMASINNVFMQTMTRIDDNFGVVDSSIIATGALVAQLGAKAMNAYGQFEQGMKIVQMVSGQTAQDIGYLSQKANEFSVQYRTDIDQITEGLQTLGRAGLNSASEQAEVLENGLTTAKLEGRELNSVLEELIQNTALLGGDLNSSSFGEDSKYVNDMLVATSMSAPITTHDVSETLKYSGGIAAAAGANIRDAEGNVNQEGKAILEDYLGAIAAFAQKGVTGSIAGTALRAFFNKPATQDSSVTEALATIHLKPEYLWEDDEETMKPISQQIQIIQNQMDKLDVSTMDRLQIWSKIVGGKMGQQMMKLDSSSIKELTNDIRSAESAESLAAGSMKTYEANIKQAQEQGAKLERSVGKILVDYVNPFLEFANKIMGFLNQDGSAIPLAVGIIAFLGAVGVRIKKIFSTIKAEISEVWQAIKGGEQVSVRQMRGNTKTGYREPLGNLGVEGATTPDQIKKAFEQELAQRNLDQYKNWKSIDVAVAEQTKSWSGKTEDKGILEASKDYGFSARHNDMIRSLIEHDKMTDEVRGILAQKGTKSFKMGTVLDSGASVQDWIEDQYIQLQKEINAEYKKQAEAIEDMCRLTEENSVEQTENSEKVKENTRLVNENAAALERENQSRLTRQDKIRQQKDGEIGVAKAVQDSQDALVKQILDEEYEKTRTTVGSGNIGSQVLSSRNVSWSGITYSEIQDSLSGKEADAAYKQILEARNKAEKDNDIFKPFYDYYGEAYSKKKGQQAFYWSNQDLGLQFDPTKSASIMKKMREGFIKGVLPDISFEDFIDREVLQSSKGNVPKDKLKEAYKTYMNRLQTSLDDFTAKQIRNRSIDSLSAAELHKYAPMLSDGYVKGWRGPNSRTADDVRNELMAYNSIKDLKVPTLQKMLRQYGVDIGTGKGWTKDKSIETLLPIVADDLKKNDSLLKDRIVKEQELAKSIEQCIKSFNKAAAAFERDSAKLNERLGKEKRDAMEKNAVTPGWYDGEINDPTDYDGAAFRAWEDRAREIEGSETERFLKDKEKELEDRNNRERKLNESAYNVRQIIRDDETKKINEDYEQHLKLNRDKYNTPNLPDVREMYGVTTRPTPTPWDGSQLENGIKDSVSNTASSIGNGVSGAIEGAYNSVRNQWQRNRAGRFNFGEEKNAAGELRSMTKGFRGAANGALNIADVFGGPLMIAMTTFTAIVNTIQMLYEDYSTKLREASDKLSDLVQKQEEAEQVFFSGQHEEGQPEIKGWEEDNPDATAEDKENALLDAYSDVYDNRNKGLSALDANTQQLAIATEEVKRAADLLGEEYLDNSMFAYDGLFSDKNRRQIAEGNQHFEDASLSYSIDKYGVKTPFQGQNYFKSGSILLSDKQKEDNYPWLKEFGPILAADIWTTGNTEKGLTGMLGNAGIATLKDQLSSTTGFDQSAFTRHGYNVVNSFGSEKDFNRLQMAFKNYKKDFSKLAKQTRRFEKATGATALGSLNSKLGQGKSMKRALKDLSVQDPKLVNYIKSLAIKTGMSEQQVLMAAQLQQLQEMQEIANNQVTPRMESLVSTAYQSVAYGGQTLNQVQGSGGGAVSAAQNAAAIAALLNAQMESKLDEQSFKDYQSHFKDPTQAKYKTQEEFAGAVQWAMNHPDESPDWLLQYGEKKVKSYAATNAMMYNPNLSTEDANKMADAWYDSVRGAKGNALYDTLRKGAQGALTNAILAGYDSQLDQEEGDGSGGGGGGSGSGNKNKGDNTGTKKERVDLVLCNKKEIPKLNVNLFKKPPSFTILNKNFKLRDVRINSEDKPKAIMAAIKNSFIDIQKRTDPKIIQDEEAVYDPNAATDGTNLPSGSTKTRTN